MRSIHSLPVLDRPREKLQAKGARALSDFELYEALVGSGTLKYPVERIAYLLQRTARHNFINLGFDQLTAIPGISYATAARLLAAIELSKRHLVSSGTQIHSVADVMKQLGHITHKMQEYLVCLSLDGGSRLIAQRTITVGTLENLLAHPREVFADAIADRAATIIIAHNHPSGDPAPSEHDIRLTGQLVAAGQLLGIPVRDHLIISQNEHYSFKQHHLI